MTTANQRLKRRWSACLLGSILLALAFHLLVAWVVPPWKFPHRGSGRQSVPFVQLVPIAATSDFVNTEPSIASATPSVAVQPEIVDLANASEVEIPAWFPMIARGRAPPEAPSLDTARMAVAFTAGRPHRTGPVAPIAWPEISNPDRMTGYIRTRYNPILFEYGMTGTVVLSLWVDDRGIVQRVRLSESSGVAMLDEIAVATFEEVVTFNPARVGRRTLPVQFDLAVPFLKAW